MKMILTDAYGNSVDRQLEAKTLEKKNDKDKSLMTFLRPLDVKGTKLLTWSHPTNDDKQWLYLPSFRRIKRIAGGQKSSSFLGSEFSFEDLSEQQLEKYTYKLLKEEDYQGQKVWVLERKPKKSNSGYTRMVSWISKTYHNPLKVEYYDRKNELLKIAEFKGYKAYTVKGRKIYRSHEIHMNNVQTKKKSSFIWIKRKLGLSYRDKEFKKGRLKK